jgi:ribonuclease HI
MKARPQFVLFSGIREHSTHDQQGGSWRFLLKSNDGHEQLEASDSEPGSTRERLELLAVVRGLEALEQPSQVTLITSSRKIARAIRTDLDQWRVDGWTWERYGERVAIKNCDLWQRIDRARAIHQLGCRRMRFDGAHRGPASPHRVVVERPKVTAPRFRLPWRRPIRVMAAVLYRLADWLDRQLPERQPHLGV